MPAASDFLLEVKYVVKLLDAVISITMPANRPRTM